MVKSKKHQGVRSLIPSATKLENGDNRCTGKQKKMFPCIGAFYCAFSRTPDLLSLCRAFREKDACCTCDRVPVCAICDAVMKVVPSALCAVRGGHGMMGPRVRQCQVPEYVVVRTDGRTGAWSCVLCKAVVELNLSK